MEYAIFLNNDFEEKFNVNDRNEALAIYNSIIENEDLASLYDSIILYELTEIASQIAFKGDDNGEKGREEEE